jgi:quercetin dioxygenase-like cupin family protein
MKHSLISIPYGSVHQHFNTGDTTVRYLSVLSPHLEYYCGLHRMIQLEPWGRIGVLPDVERSPDGKAPEGNRICLHREDALVKSGESDGAAVALASMPEFDPEHPLVVGDLDGMADLPTGFHKSQVLTYQRIGKDMNDFVMNEVEISGLLTDPPNEYGGMHAHMEAHLYILQGEGYSTVGDDKVSWKTGTAFQVPGPQTPHRHVNESDVPSEMVRIAFGIRYFFERAAKREFPYLYLSPRQAMMERNSSST